MFPINEKISNVRNDYQKNSLSKSTVSKDPFRQFEEWMAVELKTNEAHANAMILSTVDADNAPSSRVVLLRNVSYGGFTFFTNYKSKKANDIATNNKASLLFFWPENERQIRIEGEIALLPADESDRYFESRPLESKVSAWVSRQSSVVASRSELEVAYNQELKNYNEKKNIRPPHWGGYVLVPHTFEFWQGRPNRLHDRIRFVFNKTINEWMIERLMP